MVPEDVEHRRRRAKVPDDVERLQETLHRAGPRTGLLLGTQPRDLAASRVTTSSANLAPFDLETLEREENSIFAVSADCILVYFNAAYRRFAEQNGAERGVTTLGISVLDAIAGDLRVTFEEKLAQALATNVPWIHDYEWRQPRDVPRVSSERLPSRGGAWALAGRRTDGRASDRSQRARSARSTCRSLRPRIRPRHAVQQLSSNPAKRRIAALGLGAGVGRGNPSEREPQHLSTLLRLLLEAVARLAARGERWLHLAIVGGYAVSGRPLIDPHDGRLRLKADTACMA